MSRGKVRGDGAGQWEWARFSMNEGLHSGSTEEDMGPEEGSGTVPKYPLAGQTNYLITVRGGAPQSSLFLVRRVQTELLS